MSKRVLPLGDRLLVKRKEIGETAGSEGLIALPESVQKRPTDLATVVHIPELSFADAQLMSNATELVNAQLQSAMEGSADSLKALITFNAFLKIKAIQPGDTVMISKYVGTEFADNEGGEPLTMVNGDDIIAIVREKKRVEALPEKKILVSA